MERKPQTLANHGKLDEFYHFMLAPVALVTLVVSITRLVKAPSFDTLWGTVLAFAFFVLLFRLRTYPLKVQDRLIRLEERIRLQTLLPENLRSRIGEFTESQLVALRFASDGELPALAQKTLSDNLTNKQIKSAIRNWRPDYFRV